MILTNKQKYLKVCGYAVLQMKKKGISSLALDITSNNPTTIVDLEDVLDWIDKEIKDENTN